MIHYRGRLNGPTRIIWSYDSMPHTWMDKTMNLRKGAMEDQPGGQLHQSPCTKVKLC